EAKEGQHAEAHGAGHFRMLDRAGTKRTVEARWRDLMVYRREEGHDLLTLTGDGVFEDRENNQILGGDQLKLLLAPDVKAPAGAKPAESPKPQATADPGTPKFQPQRVEATGHVYARSPELIIPSTEQLVLLFKEVPPPKTPAPTAGVLASPWTSPVGPGPTPAAPVTPAAPRKPTPQ